MSDVERIDIARNRNAYATGRTLHRCIGKTGTFGAEQQCQWVKRPISAFANVISVVTRSERPRGATTSRAEVDHVGGRCSHDGEKQHLTHRYANGSAVVRIGARGVQHECVDRESACRTGDGAEVLVIVHTFEHRETMTSTIERFASHHIVEGRRLRSFGGGHDTAMQVEPGRARDHFWRGDVDRAFEMGE